MVKQTLAPTPRTGAKKKPKKPKPPPPLFQAHDKFFKIAFQDKENATDFLKAYFMKQYPDIHLDLNRLHLDDSQHVSNKLHPLYSDVVYRCHLKDDSTGKVVYVSFLFEHKSTMPSSEFKMRLQLLDYINSIHHKNQTDKLPEGIVIPIVFNQSEKSWQQKPFRGCFPSAPQSLLQFIPEFVYFVFNLADLSNEEIRMLREYSALRSVLLAMKHYQNASFLSNHFEEMINFVEEHPEKEDLWQTVFAYILGNGELEYDVVNSILKNIHSPKMKQKMDLATNKGIFGQAYRQGRAEEAIVWQTKLQNTEKELAEERIKREKELAEERIEREKERIEREKAFMETQKLRTFLSLLHGWHKNADPSLISEIALIPLQETQLWIAAFEYVQTHRATKIGLSSKQWVKRLEKKKIKCMILSETQVSRLLELLDKPVDSL
jgi:Putative transposase, YhgA-like